MSREFVNFHRNVFISRFFFCSTMPRMPPGGNPYDSQQQQGYTIVEDPRAGYFSTATLPSNAALRKPSGPGYVLVLVIHLLSILGISFTFFYHTGYILLQMLHLHKMCINVIFTIPILKKKKFDTWFTIEMYILRFQDVLYQSVLFVAFTKSCFKIFLQMSIQLIIVCKNSRV